MIISKKHKFIFLKPMKIGGSSIALALRGFDLHKPSRGGNHQTYRHITHYLGPKKINDYFTFSFVRNPWDRAVSLYHYLQQREKGRGRRRSRQARSQSFSKWVKVNPGLMRLFRPPKGGINLDFIGRFENIQEDFNTVCDKIGIPRQQLPHKNKSKHKHYTEYYDDESRRVIEERYAKDIDDFGYKFGE